MLINLRFICKGYLYTVLVSQPYKNTTICGEIYGGIKHGLDLHIHHSLLPNGHNYYSLYTYVRGVMHGNFYSYPASITLANMRQGKRINDCLTYGFYKKGKKHGTWQMIYRDGSYDYNFYENDEIIQMKLFDKYGVVKDVMEYKNGKTSRQYSLHKNGIIKLYREYDSGYCIKCVEYNDQGSEIKLRSRER